ncbi:MAG: hypothetical protein EOO90_20225 [Pedobacter sp.]|nr:MAG: hypothetical protein EOO90_20225 [Pedobacter sp.]
MDQNNNTPIAVQESDINGEKIIFDIVIKEVLTHVIVNKNGNKYSINLDGEDLGFFIKGENGEITRYGQPKGADLNYEDYFEPIEAKLVEMDK